MFFTFPEDARWNDERQAVEFGVEIGEYRGVVRVPRRVFQRLLPQRPTPERCLEAYYLQRTRFQRIAERKLRRRQLTEDGNVEISGRDLREGAVGEERRMRSFPRPLLAALAACVLLSAAAQAQVNPFRGSGSRGLSPEDNRLLFESVARLNAAEPTHVGRSEPWSNPQTNSSGTSTILRVFHSGGMVCHQVQHRVVVRGQPPAHDYRLNWCHTPSGEWKIKG